MRTITYQQNSYASLLLPSFDEPKWVLGQQNHDVLPELDEFEFPDRLAIVGTLKSYWIHSNATGLYIDDSDVHFIASSLYEDQRALSRIEWISDWLEKPGGGLEPLPNPLIWGMDFNIQQENITAHYRVPQGKQCGFWKETGSLVEPVWPWGGVYYPGCALSEIRSQYFSLMSKGVHNNDGIQQANTKITWLSSVNPQSQKLCGMTDAEMDVSLNPISFLNHIQFGSITYFLPHVLDSIGYQSADVLDYDALNGRVKLLFLRRNYGNYSA
ncbi:MAG: hypothetical protein Q8S21_06790 [Candidatus Paracaedibacteraceae bacterium]|nr:hypothetical protein [Candidatus Paracaedibacteraceae bacterium]